MSSDEKPTTTTTTPQKKRRWFPLESNPTLLTKYTSNLGFNTSLYSFTDVYSTESWALEMIPLPVLAVVFLYPLTDVQERHRKEEDAELSKQQPNNNDNNVWHIEQRIGNACGTIAVLHALANIPPDMEEISISKSGWMGRFLQDCAKGTPAVTSSTRADVLENDTQIETMHDSASSDETNNTGRGNIEDKVETHFVAFVCVDGGLYELDGRKSRPVRHGDTTQMTLLADACKVIEGFMKRDPKEVRFNIMALAPTLED